MDNRDCVTKIDFSFVIAVYNTENYVKKCIQSITSQTQDNIEIICVNDGSTDNSVKVIKEIAQNDKRIKLINRDYNKGLLVSRIEGINSALGQYVIIVDSDDYFEKNTLSEILYLAKKENVDILHFSMKVEDYTGDEIAKEWLEKNSNPQEVVINGEEIIKNYFRYKSICTSLWGKVYKTSIIKQAYRLMKPIELTIGEDIYASFYIACLAKKYKGIRTVPAYVYCRGRGVSNSQIMNLDKFKQYCQMFKLDNDILDYVRNKDKDLISCYEAMSCRLIEDCVRIYNNRIEQSDKSEAGKILSEAWKYSPLASKVFRENFGVSIGAFEIENNMENKSKISVVIPVYNDEDYLCECIDSIENQTLKDFEIILVNDGSTDRTSEIIQNYASHNSNIKVINQNNLGAAEARNKGLEAASGKYIIFLDADDFFEPNMLEQLYENAENNKSEVVIFDADKYDTINGKFSQMNILQMNLFPKKKVFSSSDIPDNIFRCINPAPWTKFYRKSFILDLGIKYQNLPNSNDLFFNVSALLGAERISVVNKVFVHYRTNNVNSIQAMKSKDPICFLKALNSVWERIESTNKCDIFKRGYVNFAIDQIFWNITGMKNESDRKKVLKSIIDNDFLMDELFKHEDTFYLDINKKTKIVYIIKLFKETYKRDTSEKLVVKNTCNKKVKVSVIMSAYNTANYVGETLDSILNQTLKDIEVICVDDGSTDNTLDILIDKAKTDNRVSVYSQENRGQSAGRNVGIQYAIGEYIYFIDSDDILAEEALEILYEKSSKHKLDIVYFDAESFLDKEYKDEGAIEKFNYSRNGYYSDIYSGEELFLKLRSNGEYFPSACLQFSRRKFILDNEVEFPIGIIHEDNVYSLKSILRAKKVSHIPKILYRRRLRNGSTMTSNISYKNCYGYFRCYILLYEDFVCNTRKLLHNNCYSEVERYISRLLIQAREAYCNMPYEQRGFEYGITDNFELFYAQVLLPVNKEIEAYRIKKQLNEEIKKCSLADQKVKKLSDEVNQKNKYIEEHKDRRIIVSYEKANRVIDDSTVKEILALKDEINRLSYELTATRMSMSCRIGRAITLLPRSIIKLFRSKNRLFHNM